jgi:hypothetical protein
MTGAKDKIWLLETPFSAGKSRWREIRHGQGTSSLCGGADLASHSSLSPAPVSAEIRPRSSGLDCLAVRYAMRFDILGNELERLAPLANHLFRELRLDDEI